MIAGGGTGGHLFPALAVAQELRRRGAEVIFVGTRGGVEARIVPQHDFPLEFISVAGFKRGRVLANLALPVKVLRSLWESRRLVRRFRPDAALGTGGYVSGPALLMAHRAGVPVILQEQNSYPGVTTRMLARFARKVFLNFEEAARFFPSRTPWQTVGNPVRTGFAAVDRTQAVRRWELNPALPTLLVFGGSQGAASLNRAVGEVLGELGAVCNLIWSRGPKATAEVSGWTGPGALAVRPFIDDMPSAYAAADLGVCRSGAMTLSELQAAGLPALLVPFPFAAADHQRYNALAYARSGGAVVVEDKEFNGRRLLDEVRRLLGDPQALREMREALARLPRLEADRIIADEVLRLAAPE